MMTKQDIAMFDVCRWKPITPKQYLETLAIMHVTMSRPEKLETTREYLDKDGDHYRLVTYAEVLVLDERGGPSHGEMQPFLMVICNAEEMTNISMVCMERTDADLCMD